MQDEDINEEEQNLKFKEYLKSQRRFSFRRAAVYPFTQIDCLMLFLEGVLCFYRCDKFAVLCENMTVDSVFNDEIKEMFYKKNFSPSYMVFRFEDDYGFCNPVCVAASENINEIFKCYDEQVKLYKEKYHPDQSGEMITKH